MDPYGTFHACAPQDAKHDTLEACAPLSSFVILARFANQPPLSKCLLRVFAPLRDTPSSFAARHTPLLISSASFASIPILKRRQLLDFPLLTPPISRLTPAMLSLSRLAFALSMLAVFVTGCSHPGKSKTATMIGARETTRAWISDGSRVRFADTERLKGSNPGFFKQSYEGWVDERVAIRFGSVAPTESGYEGEAEWTVEFQEPIAKLAATNRLNAQTKVRLRGMIEGKELRGLAKPGRADWAPFSIGNNVLTDGGTGWWSLEELDHLGDRFQLQVVMRSRIGATIVHRSPWSDVGDKTRASVVVLAIATSFAAQCESRHPEWNGVRLLNLSAQGKQSAFVQETGRKWNAALGTIVHPFETLEGVARGGTPVDVVRTRLGRQVAKDDAGIAGRIEMELRDRDQCVGRATLNLVSTFTGS
jgi:hypothetical protein